MIAVCAAVAWLLLTPADLRRFGESIFATTVFASNVLFWLQSGYFAAPLESRPLLHTWSLAVEEQFYLVYPIGLGLIFWLLPSRVIAITLALAVLSFGLNVALVETHPNFAFFQLPTRAWELCIGAVLAMSALSSPRTMGASELAGLLGIGLICCAVFGFSKNTVFPGFAALVPTMGAAAIIWAGRSKCGTITRLLSYRPFVLIGKASYSLYLWHFPLLSFAAYMRVDGLSLELRFALVALSTILAFASWIYVEQPIRRGEGGLRKSEGSIRRGCGGACIVRRLRTDGTF